MAVLLTAPLLYSCMLLPPTPTDEQILQAVTASNNTQTEPLELIYEEMQSLFMSKALSHCGSEKMAFTGMSRYKGDRL